MSNKNTQLEHSLLIISCDDSEQGWCIPNCKYTECLLPWSMSDDREELITVSLVRLSSYTQILWWRDPHTVFCTCTQGVRIRMNNKNQEDLYIYIYIIDQRQCTNGMLKIIDRRYSNSLRIWLGRVLDMIFIPLGINWDRTIDLPDGRLSLLSVDSEILMIPLTIFFPSSCSAPHLLHTTHQQTHLILVCMHV